MLMNLLYCYLRSLPKLQNAPYHFFPNFKLRVIFLWVFTSGCLQGEWENCVFGENGGYKTLSSNECFFTVARWAPCTRKRTFPSVLNGNWIIYGLSHKRPAAGQQRYSSSLILAIVFLGSLFACINMCGAKNTFRNFFLIIPITFPAQLLFSESQRRYRKNSHRTDNQMSSMSYGV